MKKIALLSVVFLIGALTACELGMKDIADELTTAPGAEVIYNANGADRGSAPGDEAEYKEGFLVTVLDNTGNLERDNSYYFTGWNTEPGGTGTNYLPGQTFAMGRDDVTLYARWRQGTFYRVTYDANGGVGDVPAGNTYYESGTTVYVKNSGTLSKYGYTFGGWNRNSGGTGTNYTAGDSFVITANTTLYAKWEGGATYTVTYYANGGTGSVPVDDTSYIANAEVNVLANTGNLYSLGYKFEGWTIGSGGLTTYVPGSKFNISSNTDLYAKWGTYSYLVAFDSQGANTAGSPASINVISPNWNVGILPSDPVKTYYDFGGWWSLTGGGGNQFFANTQVTDNTTVFAKWTAKNYNIIFDKNDTAATGTMSNQIIPYGTTSALNSCGYSKTDWHFTGWATSSSGNVAYLNQANYTMNTGGATLYAKWAVNSGSLDSSFGGGDGIITTGIGTVDHGNSVVLQPDGKIVVAGDSYNGSKYGITVVRYNTDGSLDSTFGSGDGIVTYFYSGTSSANSVVLQSDGKIVIVGFAFYYDDCNFIVVRYNTDGSLDTTFSGDGIVTTNTGSTWDYGYSVVLQPDGKIVVAGQSYIGSNYDITVVRYNTDGSLDSTFGGDGIVTTGIGTSSDAGNSVVIQSDGKIVVAGYSYNGSNNDVAVVRYNTDGSLDTSFSGDGIITTSIGTSNENGQSVALQSDGKIVVAGYSNNGSNNDVAVVRYNTDGSLDTSFSGDGIITTDISAGQNYGYSVAIQADGKIVVAGTSYDDFAVLRYNTNGTLDTTFEGDGIFTTGIGSGVDQGNSVAIQTDGKIVVAGFSNNGSNYDFAVIRLWP